MRIVALDLGKKNTTYCEVSEGQVVRRVTVSAVESLQSLLGPEQAKAKVAIEAGREAWYVHDQLAAWGNEVVLVDTTRCRRLGIGQHGRKNDRIDAETLARALEAGTIPKAHILASERRELRQVLGVRRALIESRANLVTTARGLLTERGVKVPSCNTESFVNTVRAQKLSPELTHRISPLLDLLENINRQVIQVDEELAVLSDKEPVTQVLTTAPGVATVVAASFVSVVDDAKRFRTAHQVESYIGLVPSENTSGGKRRIGSISKQGNSYLRALLVQSAWTILCRGDKNDPLHIWGNKVATRRGKRVAVVALARRLVGVLWAMWRDGTVYDAPYLAQRGVRGVRRAVQSLEQQAAALEKAAKKRSVKKPASSTSAKSRQAQQPRTTKAA